MRLRRSRQPSSAMDYGALPPEINSARMYAGPGSSSMEAAATAWNGLAAELRSAASSYGSIISELTDESWTGPSSTEMAAAAALYVAWINSTAAEAEQTASQAMSAAAAYQSAFAMTVSPATVSANRAHLASLVATNTFGQNTPAIAANRDPIRRNVGPGRRRDVRLCREFGGRQPGDAVHRGAADHQPGRVGRAERRGHPGHRNRRRQRTGVAVGADLPDAAKPRVAGGLSTRRPSSGLLGNLLGNLSLTSAATGSATGGLSGLGTSLIGRLPLSPGVFWRVPGNRRAVSPSCPMRRRPHPRPPRATLPGVGPKGPQGRRRRGWRRGRPGRGRGCPRLGRCDADGGAGSVLAGDSGVAAGLGEAPSLGGLSVPPNWLWSAAPPPPMLFPAGRRCQGPTPTTAADWVFRSFSAGYLAAAAVAARPHAGGAAASKFGSRLKVVARPPSAGYPAEPEASPPPRYPKPAAVDIRQTEMDTRRLDTGRQSFTCRRTETIQPTYDSHEKQLTRTYHSLLA